MSKQEAPRSMNLSHMENKKQITSHISLFNIIVKNSSKGNNSNEMLKDDFNYVLSCLATHF